MEVIVVTASAESDGEHFRLTNLPHVYIETFDGRSVTSKTNEVLARMWMVDERDSVAFYDSLLIRGRGNSTWGMAKKPYRIKFAQKEKLLGKGYAKAKKWILLANHGDKTLIRNALTFHMGEWLGGLPFNPVVQFVDLTLNGSYVGNYHLTDQVEVRAHRVNIEEQDFPLTESSNITGGYLLEADDSNDFYNGQNGFYTSRNNVPVRIHYPDEDEIDQSQYKYIRSFLLDFDTRLSAHNFKDPDQWRALVDSVTLADWYIATEVSGNVDGFYSTYFYKNQDDDHLYWGPLWDYDIAYNNDNRTRAGSNNTTRQLMKDAGYGNLRAWVVQMWKDPWFSRLINRRFRQVVNNGLEDYLIATVDSLAQLIDASQQLNYQRWGIRQGTLRELVLYSTYGEYVNDLRKYIHDHIRFLGEAFAKLAPDDPEPEPEPEPKKPGFVADTMSYYAISNKGSGTFLDVNAENGTIVCNARDEKSESQQWRIFPLSNGFLYVVNRATGYALNDPTEGEPTATTLVGTQLNIASGDSLDLRQQWDFVAQTGDHFNLVSRYSEHAANLNGGNSADGTTVLSYTSDSRNASSNNRLWNLQAVDVVVESEPDGVQGFEESPDFALAYDPVSCRLHFGADDLSVLRFFVRLYDHNGRLLRTFRASDGTNLGDLPQGLYLVTWEWQGGSRTVKFSR